MTDETIERLRTVLREDPDSRQFVALGRALAAAGEWDEAARILEEGLRRHPRLAEGWVVLAGVELERGNLRAVEAACARALDVDAENADAARLIARAASRRGDWKRALSAWRLTLALAPGDAEAADGLAEAERNLAEPAKTPEGSGTGEGPEPETAPPPPAPAAERPFPEPEPPSEVSAPPAPPRLPREVVTVAEPEDPFLATPRGDTGVWFTGEDVFALDEAAAPETPSAAGGGDEPFGEPAAVPGSAEPEAPPSEAAATVEAAPGDEPSVGAGFPEPVEAAGPEAEPAAEEPLEAGPAEAVSGPEAWPEPRTATPGPEAATPVEEAAEAPTEAGMVSGEADEAEAAPDDEPESESVPGPP